MHSFSTAAEVLINNRKSQPVYTYIFTDWNSIVGERFALVSKPSGICKQNNEKILVIEVAREHALELQHETQTILNAVNRAIGSQYFSRIKVTVLHE